MKRAIVLILILAAAECWSMGYRPEHIAADSAWLVEIQERMEKVDTMFAAAQWEYYTNGEYTGNLERARKEWNLIIYHSYNIGRIDRIQGLFENPVLNRAAKLTYIKYLTQWCNLGTDIWRIYRPLNDILINYRADFEGEKRTNGYLAGICGIDSDRERRQKAWFARNSIGKKIASGLIELVKERNRLARRKDYDHFYEFKINVMGLTTDRVLGLLDMLNLATRDVYLDIYLERKDRLSVDKLEMWDLSYDPDRPGIGHSYSKDDLLPTLYETFDNMGFQTDKLGITFDIEPRDNKLQNGLCMPVSVPNDIRILASVGCGRGSFHTVFHEYGHALHFSHIDQEHYILRDRTDHIICESMANFCEEILSQPQWLMKYMDIPEEDIPDIIYKLNEYKIINLRCMLAYVYFEIELYRTNAENPDKLFWDTIGKLLFCGRQDGSEAWAAIYHFTAAPIYCQNYILGDLIAAQTMHHMRELNGSIIDNQATAEYLIERYFKHGARYDWFDLVERATGEKLNTEYYLKGILGEEKTTEEIDLFKGGD